MKPTPKPPVAIEEDDWLVPLVKPGDASIDAKGTTATVKITCPQGCAGDLELVPLVATQSAKAKRKLKPLARKHFTAKPGKRTTIKLKLGKKARKALRRARRAKLRIVYTTPVKRTQTLTLKLRRR